MNELIPAYFSQFGIFSELFAGAGFCELEYAGVGSLISFPKPRAGCSNHPGGTNSIYFGFQSEDSMYLSIPALKEIVIDTISKKIIISRDRVKEVLECDGAWADHDRFLMNTFVTARQHPEASGVDLSVAVGEPAGFTELEGEESLKSAERLAEVSKETGQPFETIKAVNVAYFKFIDNATTMIKKKFGKSDAAYLGILAILF